MVAQNDELENEQNANPAGVAVVPSVWIADGVSACGSLVSLPTSFASLVESHPEERNGNICKVKDSEVDKDTIEEQPNRNDAGSAVVVSAAGDVPARWFPVNLFSNLSSFVSFIVDSCASIFMASSKHCEGVCEFLRIFRTAGGRIWWPPDLYTTYLGLQQMVT